MSTLAAGMSFDFNFHTDPATPPSYFDSSLLEIPSFIPGHTRSSSSNSVFSTLSHSTAATEASATPASEPPVTSRRKSATPARSPQTPAPIRQHGPILLPKIRSQDQDIAGISAPMPAKRQRTQPPASSTPPPSAVGPAATAQFRSLGHGRSYTNPEPVYFSMNFTPPPEEQMSSNSLLCSPVSFAQDSVLQTNDRRASSCGSIDGAALEKYGFPTYRQLPSYMSATPSCSPPATTAPLPPQSMLHPHAESFMFPSCAFPKAPSPLSLGEPISMSSAPEVQQPTTTLLSYLTAPNPAPSLVRTISIPLRDPNTKHFWWDVRQVRPWSTFNAQTIMSLPGALATLTTPVPQSILAMPTTSARHPETEQQLHSIYASHYIPRLNSALATSSSNPVQFSLPSKAIPGLDNLILAHVAGDSASAAAIFGGKPSARVVGLVRSFDRFNTGMRVEGNIKRVEYLRGLAALHYAMREHGCRYGFILTEIELVLCRNGSDATPNFGYLEVTSLQLAASSEREGGAEDAADQQELTACLALWGLGMMAGMDRQSAAQVGVAPWRAEIGAPAEGTRRKALARDNWMPNPQLAEKREAKRARGWVMPEDPVGRKELGKRGVRYGAC